MSRGILAVTSGGVEVVLPVDPESLKVLAQWICDEACVTNQTESHNCGPDCPACNNYEYEQEKNGGYCDKCRDFAGRLLTESPLADLLANGRLSQDDRPTPQSRATVPTFSLQAPSRSSAGR